MAEKKPKKKPRHMRLVVPGDSGRKAEKRDRGKKEAPPPPVAKDRLGRTVAAGDGIEAQARPAEPPMQPPAQPAQPVAEKRASLFDAEAAEEKTAAPPPEKQENESPAPPQSEAAAVAAKAKAAIEAKSEAEAGKPGRTGAPAGEQQGERPAPRPEGPPGRPAANQNAGQAAGRAGLRPVQDGKDARQAGPRPDAGSRAGAAGGPQDDALPKNAIRMPKPRRKSRLTPKKRRRRRRLIQLTVAAVLVLAVVLFFTTGAYLTTATLVGDAFDGLRIAARPGDGFPMSFAMVGFVKAESMGGNGFAALGERDAAMVSATGAELRRIQHNYMTPGLSAGKTRMVVYSRGGTEYTVEGRNKTLAAVKTEQDIQFAEISPDGWLAVVTSSRYQSNLDIYGPDYDTQDPLFHMPVYDEKPVLAAFQNDNRSLVLACVSARDGSLGTTLYLLRRDRAEVQAQVRADGAQVLAVEYLDNHQVLAVFDGFTALYNQKGEELARFSHGGRRLVACDIEGNMVALAFAATTGEAVHTVLLNDKLEMLFDKAADASGSCRVLAARDGAWLLCGQRVLGYDRTGAATGSATLEGKAFTLVQGGVPLALSQGAAEDLRSLTGAAPAAASGPGSGAGGPDISDAGAPGESAPPASEPDADTPADADSSNQPDSSGGTE